MKRKDILCRLLNFVRPHSGYLAAALAFAVGGVGLTLLAPVLIGKGIDYIIGPENVAFEGVLRIMALLAATTLGVAALQWLQAVCTNAAAYRTIRDIRRAVFEKLSRAPLKYIDGNPQGDIISRVVTDIDLVSDGLLQGFTQLFTGIVTIIGTLGFMLSISWRITAAVVLLTPLSLFVASFIAKRSHASFVKQSASRGELGGCVDEMVSGHRVVKAFGREGAAQAKFEEINSWLYDSGVKAQFYSSLTNPCTRFVNNLVYAAAGILGGLGAISGAMTVGQISTVLAYANQYTKPFNEISGVATELETALASAARAFAVLDEREEASDEGAKVIERCDGTARLERVCFSYHPDASLIEDLNLNVKSGSTVAIVGPTGCGKTTLINLLMRFYDVTSGSISVSGYDVREVTRASLRRCYGMVLQDTWLFTGTIRENIAYGKPGATAAEIEEAAKSAHAHSFIMRMHDGYDTMVYDGGGNLSQGQRQLLCIARVMLARPPMLILDEATSSIDTRTELRVQQAFALLMEGRTSFVVAHRLSTIREADVILVMNQGRVLEQGTHDELLKKGGFYANLYNSQFSMA